jgi:hypothetical protein
MPQKKPILFLIQPDTHPDRPQGWYCPDCAIVQGALAYYPQLRDFLDIRLVDFPRPRTAITSLIGDAYQDCPLLLLDPSHGPSDAPVVNGYRIVTENTKRLLDLLATLAPGVSKPGKGSLFA